MPIDPSIPLGFKGVDVGELLANQQNNELRKLQLQEARMKIENARAEKDAYGQIFGGMSANSTGGPFTAPSAQSLGALARVDPQAAMQVKKYFDGLDEDSRKRQTDKWKAAAPTLLRLKQVPYEQRGAILQNAAPILIANGWSPQELQTFDPTDQKVDALASAAMTVDQVISSNKLDWHPIGENGSFATDNMGNPVGAGNPFAPKPQQQQKPAGSLNDVFGALKQQESGNTPGKIGPRTRYGIPMGSTQMLPETAKEMAGKLGLPWQPELMTGTSPDAAAYQERLGRAYFDEGLSRYGGDIEKALMYYHGGPDERKWGPKTRTYARSVLARARAGANPDEIRAKAQAAIQAGADPQAVRARAAAMGVSL
jgi:hypothetical protein